MTHSRELQSARAHELSEDDKAFLDMLKGRNYVGPSEMLAYVCGLKPAARPANMAAVCRALVHWGASVGAIAHYQRSGLHLAAKNDEVDVCRVLVELGADPRYSPPARPSPKIYYALRDGDDPVRTPFEEAVLHESYNVVKFFVLECGVDPAPRGPSGKTPIQLAYKSAPMKELLRSLKVERGIRADIASTPEEQAPGRAPRGHEPL
jgi:ankyrin repeat protein